MDELNGEVRLGRALDYERQRAHTLLIEATDMGAPNARSSTATLIITGIRREFVHSSRLYNRFVVMNISGSERSSPHSHCSVENVNDEQPRVEVDYLGPRDRAAVSEGAERGEFVALVFVYDADPAPPLDCVSTNPRFALSRKQNGGNGNGGGARYGSQPSSTTLLYSVHCTVLRVN